MGSTTPRTVRLLEETLKQLAKHNPNDPTVIEIKTSIARALAESDMRDHLR